MKELDQTGLIKALVMNTEKKSRGFIKRVPNWLGYMIDRNGVVYSAKPRGNKQNVPVKPYPMKLYKDPYGYLTV